MKHLVCDKCGYASDHSGSVGSLCGGCNEGYIIERDEHPTQISMRKQLLNLCDASERLGYQKAIKYLLINDMKEAVKILEKYWPEATEFPEDSDE